MTRMVTSEPTTPNRAAAADLIRLRKQAYCTIFNSADDASPLQSRSARVVLADLARFCRAQQSTFDPNPQVQARLDGRREVWLRIADHLQMDEGELYDLFVRGIK